MWSEHNESLPVPQPDLPAGAMGQAAVAAVVHVGAGAQVVGTEVHKRGLEGQGGAVGVWGQDSVT